ncbi:hypothetical protein ANCCAN_11794 [Ancylostoma caninum]|uniref:Uncharacterized protein n=1 Tax=Ancylostoma caninum TaxID=29170 RepID=A0A368GCV4_ANCCA|nr:hypothetical protein ANCCAN_11794 [Ancylostoma caninum]
MKAIVLLIFLVFCVISTVNASCREGRDCPPHQTCIKNRCVARPQKPRPRPNKGPCAGKQSCPQPRPRK